MFFVSIPVEVVLAELALELAAEDSRYKPSDLIVRKYKNNNIMITRKACKKLKRKKRLTRSVSALETQIHKRKKKNRGGLK